jgi:hypothetical protein
VNFYRRFVALEKLSNCPGMSVQVYKDFVDAGALADLEPDMQHGRAADWNQTLGDMVGKRFEPGAVSSRQQECLHLLLTIPERAGIPEKRFGAVA